MGYILSKLATNTRVVPIADETGLNKNNCSSRRNISESTLSRTQTAGFSEEVNKAHRIIVQIAESNESQSALFEESYPPHTILENASSNPEIEKNPEDITLVWLSENRHETNLSNLRISLREINNYIKIFDDESECLSYLTNIDKEQIFIIIDGSAINHRIVSRINDIFSVDSIFLFNRKTNTETAALYADLKHDFNKVTYFADFEKMSVVIKEDIKQLVKQSVGFSLFDEREKSTMDLTRDAATFLWFQMLFKVLKNQFQSDRLRREMIVTCRRVYAGNCNELANIDGYHRDEKKTLNAIHWYTKECFLYRLVNKALRTEDIDSLCTFSPFIVDLCSQLTAEHERRVQSDTSASNSIMILYRGQQISQTEIDKMRQNKGKLISTNGFFSTTTAEMIATTFAKQRRNVSSDIVAVIFEIRAQSNLNAVIFADIRHVSAMGPGEEEVLFSIGAVFRIDDVVYDNNRSLWTILMTATDEGYENVLPFIEATAQNREETSDNVFFGRLLNDMGRYQQAETYCKKLLQTMPKNHPDRAGVYHNLGRAQGNKGELNEATDSFTQALEIRRSLDMNHPDVARTLNSLGIIHGEKGEYGKAMRMFEKALEIQSKNNPHNNKEDNMISKKNLLLNMAMSHSNIGWAHSLCGTYDKAYSAHDEALKIRKDLLKVEDHPLFADYHSAMGGIAHAKGLYDNARAEHTKALLMRQRILPPAHPSIANSYQSLGEIEHENGKYEKALDYYEEARHIRTQTLGVQHLSMAAIYKSIGSVHLDSGAYDKALVFYERALSICQKNLSSSHPAIGDCYHLIGTVYERQMSIKNIVCICVKIITLQ
ncbi:unnamed protein product [Rotaria magnacalcarata]|uniref:Uncharacterized protein n=1 Tax=Rotaria magnacalcarata TaxID=392030 RepID=A0A815ITS7_9BILA|nr:unnamed protein product [Rotaria magnacalcarata]CAF4083924.1 unnamed protein product [Rotaria magnacalcarata]